MSSLTYNIHDFNVYYKNDCTLVHLIGNVKVHLLKILETVIIKPNTYNE